MTFKAIGGRAHGLKWGHLKKGAYLYKGRGFNFILLYVVHKVFYEHSYSFRFAKSIGGIGIKIHVEFI